MHLPEKNHNFKIGFKNIKGLHDKNGCKIHECGREFYNDIEFLSETWGCPCEKQFEGYDLIGETLPQKHENINGVENPVALLYLGKKD